MKTKPIIADRHWAGHRPQTTPMVSSYACQAIGDEPIVRMVTFNGLQMCAVELDFESYRALLATLEKAAEEAWG